MKKMFSVLLVIVLMLSFGTTVFASAAPAWGGGFMGGRGPANAPRWGMQASGGIGLWGAGFAMFWDANGNFLSRSVVEANLASAVANGDITAAERDFLLARYDFCATLGGGAVGVPRGLGMGIWAWQNF